MVITGLTPTTVNGVETDSDPVVTVMVRWAKAAVAATLRLAVIVVALVTETPLIAMSELSLVTEDPEPKWVPVPVMVA
jgi:hypothetical protein